MAEVGIRSFVRTDPLMACWGDSSPAEKLLLLGSCCWLADEALKESVEEHCMLGEDEAVSPTLEVVARCS